MILLVSSGQRPGILLKTVQYTEQSTHTKNYPTLNVSSAEVEKPRYGTI